MVSDKPQEVRTEKARHVDFGWLRNWERVCGEAEGKSPNTIALTDHSLGKLESFLEGMGHPAKAESVTPEIMRGFTMYLQSGHRPWADHPHAGTRDGRLSDQTVNCYLRTIRAAWNRWIKEDIVTISPFDKVKMPKVSKKVVPTLSEKQVKDLLGAIDTSNAEGFRDHLLIRIYLDTGCRLGELTGVQINDMDLAGKRMRIRGKGGKERFVFFGSGVQKGLMKYLKMYRPEPAMPQCDHLFLTRDGSKLTNQRVQSILKKYGSRARITGVRCSPHTLRHTFCVMWIRNGGNIFDLQQMTGHSSLEVLRGYVNLAISDVEKAHQKCSPVDNLLGV